MAEVAEVALDRAQVKKAVQALQAFIKSKTTAESLFLEETQKISLLFTLWKIPKKAQTIRIPLPHGQRPDTDEVCLFTRDEPSMTSEQTQRFYKKLLQEKGVQNITEIIPYKVLRTEYKPHEAKRRLLSNFDMFLSDDRVRRLLPSQLGKHFYLRKKEPLCVNLQSKHLARDVHRVIQGTNLKVTNRGCCCMAHIGHAAMTADEVTENVEAAVQTVAAKLHTKGPVMKVIHIKSKSSVALPIYTSDLNNLTVLEEAEQRSQASKKAASEAKKQAKKKTTEDTKQSDATGEGEEEEIPQLVPIATPSKKPKLESPIVFLSLQKNPPKKKKQQLQKMAKKKRNSANKMAKKAGKTDSKVKRKVPKVK